MHPKPPESKLSFYSWKDLWYPTTDHLDVCVGYGRNHGDHPIHIHEDFIELVIVTEGEGINLLEKKPYRISKGSIFVIHPKQAHGYIDTKKISLYNVCIRAVALKELPLGLLAAPGYIALFKVEPVFRQKRSLESHLKLEGSAFKEIIWLTERLKNRIEDPRPLSRVCAKAIFTEILAQLACEYQASQPATFKAPSLEAAKAISFMETHYTEPITVDEIARRTGFTVRTLHRACLDYLDLPPKKIINNLRIEGAMRLLRESKKSVTEVAFASGFLDSNYFSKCFKDKTGMTPRKFRNSSQEIPS